MFCLSSPQQEAGGKYRGIKRYHLPRFQPQRERGPALFRGEADYGVLQSGCSAYGRGEGALQQGKGAIIQSRERRTVALAVRMSSGLRMMPMSGMRPK